jgi:hypothetical protein
MDRATLIDLIETKHRMRIDPNDSVFLLASITELLTAEAQAKADRTAERIEAAATRIEAVKAPIADSDLRRLETVAALGAQRQAATLARSHNRRTLAIAAGVLTATLTAGMVIGYWSGRDAGIDVAWSRMSCGDQPDGSRVCYYFTRQRVSLAPVATLEPAPQNASAPAPETKPTAPTKPISARRQ